MVVLCFVAVEGKEHALTSIITFVLTRGTGGGDSVSKWIQNGKA